RAKFTSPPVPLSEFGEGEQDTGYYHSSSSVAVRHGCAGSRRWRDPVRAADRTGRPKFSRRVSVVRYGARLCLSAPARPNLSDAKYLRQSSAAFLFRRVYGWGDSRQLDAAR